MSTPPATRGRARDEGRVARLRRRSHARRDHWRAEHRRAEHFWERLRWLIFGDWHPVLRDPLDLLRLSFGAAALIFLLRGNVEFFVRFTGAFLVLVAVHRLRVPQLFDLLFIIGLGLSIWGTYFHLSVTANYCFRDVTLGTRGYNHLCVGWDKLVHLVLPTASVPVLYILGLRLGLVPDLAEETKPRLELGLILYGVMSCVCVCTIYEIYEYVDVWWFSGPLNIGFSDTIMDLVNAVIAGLLGGTILAVWSKRHWPTDRQPLFA